MSVILTRCKRMLGHATLVLTAVVGGVIVGTILGGGALFAYLNLPENLRSPATFGEWFAVALLALFPMLALAPLLQWWLKVWYNLDQLLTTRFFAKTLTAPDARHDMDDRENTP